MRAAKMSGGTKKNEMHISGAEGIYNWTDISTVISSYTKRALSHSRGKPDKVVITIEKIFQKPKKINLLPVTTLKCSSPTEAKEILAGRLSDLGIFKPAIKNAFKVLVSKKTMRGASLIRIESGKRVEPDKMRGVRVSRFGMEKSADRKLVQRLSLVKLDATTVKEALMLASKASAYPDVIAEVCISDDPDYTTGYIASKKFGYVRIPNIKKPGKMYGGRVFFIKEDSSVSRLMEYFEKVPVILY